MKTDKKVAEILGVEYKNFHSKKILDYVPANILDKIQIYALKKSINIEYILTGRGEKNTKSEVDQGIGENLSEEEVEYQIYKQMLHENLERVLEEGTQKMKLDTVNQINGFIKEMREKNVESKGWFFKKGKGK